MTTVAINQALSATAGEITPVAASPSRSAWQIVRLGLERGAQLVVALIGGLSMIEFGSGLGWFADFLIGFVVIGLLYSGLNGLVTLLWKLTGVAAKGLGTLVSRRLSPISADKAMAPYRFVHRVRGQSIGAVVAPVVILLLDQVKIGGASVVNLPSVTESLIPFGIMACVLISVALVHDLKSWVRVAATLGAVLVFALPLGWYLWPGTNDYLARPDAEALAALPEFRFENPGLPGAHRVHMLIYGSGQARRPEFGKDADLLTPTVDPSLAYTGWTGLAARFYEWHFGFDYKHLPLAGQIWYPDGAGPFPIVLIVHGNHKASDYSDPGYAYLGQHFASRGFITVSVDENFLNGHAFWDGSGAEMPIRAWLLLKHLQVWRDWNGTPGNPFYRKVDLDRVVLMGHSRGGEAVSHAAVLNQKLTSPVSILSNDGEFGFGIRGVVAIAPADGQWRPYGMERKVVDVSYLLIQGGHDQDLSSLAGIRQYNRVGFEANPDAFKSVAYIYRANHGNFSTVWGDSDHGLSGSMILNRAGLLSGEEQRAAARVFMTSFLEATLNGKDEYRKVFVSPSGARNWLPNDIYVTEYQDATFKTVNTFERPGKVEIADMPETKTAFSGLVKPSRTSLQLRDGIGQGDSAFEAEWTASSDPTYSLTLPQGGNAAFSLTGEERLAFELCNAGEGPGPVYVTVELVDAKGAVAVQPANRYGVVPPLSPTKLEKSKPVSRLLNSDFFPKVKTPYERVLQSFEIPLDAFAAANPAFDPTQIVTIRFRFNDEQAGKAYLDEIGFRG